MHELHEPQAQGKGNPNTANSETTTGVPNNSESLEFSLPPRRCEQCGKRGLTPTILQQRMPDSMARIPA